MIESLWNRQWVQYLVLLVLSAGIYLFYFPSQILHPNSFLSSITGDSIKNYYTFIYHIKHDQHFLHFGGMNYPFGEHVVYTDCQPLLTWILRALPFTHDYLIGILHSFIFWSFIITPLVIFKLLKKQGVGAIPGALFSLGISVLSPLFLKIYWGHFALAYGWIIPLLFLVLLKIKERPRLKNFIFLFIYNLLLFFVHPYTALSCCVFTFIYGVICFFSTIKTKSYRQHFFVVFCAVAPVLLFRIFMLLTDTHTGRAAEPMNSGTLVANLGCLLVPAFGPMAVILQKVFQTSPSNYEGFCYLGVVLLGSIFVLVPFLFIKIKLAGNRKFMAVLLVTSIFLLFISFGWLSDLLEFMGIKSNDLRQFRAIARLDNFVYFALPCFLFTFLNELLRSLIPLKKDLLLVAVALLYLCGNIIESHFMFKVSEETMWRSKNFFSTQGLENEQKKILGLIVMQQPQALTTLPLFLYGSEVIDRDNWNNSMIPAMLYSSHSGVPIIGSNMSRTSVEETEQVLDIFNEYKRERFVLKSLSKRPVIVFITKNPMLPSEERLKEKVQVLHRNDTISTGTIGFRDLIFSGSGQIRTADSVKGDSSFLFIGSEDRKPFHESRMEDYEKIFTLLPGRLRPGRHVVSFHFHYSEKSHRGLACNLIMTRKKGEEYEWFFNDGIKRLSASYPGFLVYEVFLDVVADTQYEFLLKGSQDSNYRISNFLIRKEHETVTVVSGKDTLINNYPVSDPGKEAP